MQLRTVAFLGTSSGVPTADRGVSATALEVVSTSKKGKFCNNELWLVDVGEGTQQQMLRHAQRERHSSLRPSFERLTRIFITHLHGDHCFGLPGLLAMKAMRSKASATVDADKNNDPSSGDHSSSASSNEVEVVHIVGPAGVREFVETSLRISQTFLPFTLNFMELTENETIVPVAGAAVLEREGGDSLCGIAVRAVKLKHRVPCFGYVFSELQGSRPGSFSAEIAQARFGIPRGPVLGQLSRGVSVNVNGIDVRYEDCLQPALRPHVAVILGDTSESTLVLDALRQLRSEFNLREGESGPVVDLLVHECTFDVSMYDKAVVSGHSTSKMVGCFAESIVRSNIPVETLVISHFSQRYATGSDSAKDKKTVDDLLAETRAACPSVRCVVAAKEHLELSL